MFDLNKLHWIMFVADDLGGVLISRHAVREEMQTDLRLHLQTCKPSAHIRVIECVPETGRYNTIYERYPEHRKELPQLQSFTVHYTEWFTETNGGILRKVVIDAETRTDALNRVISRLEVYFNHAFDRNTQTLETATGYLADFYVE